MGKEKLIERRFVDIEEPELRDVGDGIRQFSGYAARFGEWADIGGAFRESIAPGAFTKTIREADVPLVYNHDPSTVMARTSNGTVRLSEDDKGLRVEADLNTSDPDSARVASKMDAGLVNKMSFAFRAIRQSWDKEAKPLTRTIREAALYDVSPVTSPAYTGTSAQLREARSVLEAEGVDLQELDEARDALEFAEALAAIVTASPEMVRHQSPEEIRAAIDTLSTYLAPAEPVTDEADHSLSKDVAMRRLALRKRRAGIAA